MQSVERWFDRTSARERRAVFLEDALLGGRFFAYGYYRLRFFLGRSLVEIFLHAIEFAILAFIFSQGRLVSALIFLTLCRFLNACWWGVLEGMRTEIRSLHRQGQSHLIARELSQWFRLAIVGAAVVMSLSVGWIVFDVNRPLREFDAFHLFVFAVSLQLSLGFLARSYHSAVYAIRRVYRPFLAIVGVQILGFVGTFLAWPALGVWSFPIMLVPMAILANGLTFYYVRRVYRFLGLRKFRIRFGAGFTRGMGRGVTGRFYLGGFSYAFARLDDVLILSLSYGAYQSGTGYDLFVFFYLIRPLLRAAYEWAQLFYFDFKRLELDLFRRLKQRFEKFVQGVAGVVGTVLGLLACLLGTVLTGRNLGIWYLLLVVFFLVRSHLAFHQIRVFSEERYWALLTSSLFVVASTTVFTGLATGGAERFALYVMALGFPALAFALTSLATKRPPVTVLSLPDWLGQVKALTEPVRVRSVWVAREAEKGSLERVTQQIGRTVGAQSPLTLAGERCIAWYETPSMSSVPSTEKLLEAGAGLMDGVRSTEYARDGAQALALVKREGVLGDAVKENTGESQDGYRVSEIAERFRTAFPEGVMFDPSERAPKKIRRMSSAERRELMYGAVAYSKSLFRRVRRARFDVTTLFTDGNIRLIFGIPLSTPRRTRSAWRSFISETNVSCAIRAESSEEGLMLFGTLKRTILFTVAVATPAASLWSVPVEDYVTGTFRLEPAVHAGVRAPVASFLREVNYDEGEQVPAGAVIGRLEVPDLASRMARKRAEIAEVEANLRLLEAGTRPELIEVQRGRVELAESLRAQARSDLANALREELKLINKRIERYRAELEFARVNHERTKKLFENKAIHEREVRRTRKEYEVAKAQYQQASAERQARRASVILQTESEIAEREQELAEAQATLRLMEAGTRSEKVDAERARLARLKEEVRYLEHMQEQLTLHSPVDGIVTTAKLREKIGRYFREGELIVEVANPGTLEAEVTLPEEHLAKVARGQAMVLKAYALPYDTFGAEVERVAPVIEADQQQRENKSQKRAKLSGQLHDGAGELRPGMTGYARIYLERRSAGSALLERFVRFVRTEFWW